MPAIRTAGMLAGRVATRWRARRTSAPSLPIARNTISAEKTRSDAEKTVLAIALRLRSAWRASVTWAATTAAWTATDASPSAAASSGPSWMTGASPT